MVSIESQVAALPSTSLGDSAHSAATAASGGSSHLSSAPSPSPKKSPEDLCENLIVFGVKESRVLSDTMASVKKMLEFLTGRSTPVKDMYRIGIDVLMLRLANSVGRNLSPAVTATPAALCHQCLCLLVTISRLLSLIILVLRLIGLNTLCNVFHCV